MYSVKEAITLPPPTCITSFKVPLDEPQVSGHHMIGCLLSATHSSDDRCLKPLV